jgi:LemA protein
VDTTTIISLAIVALLLGWAVVIYNQLVALSNRYQNGFAQIEVQLKRRYDLIPNLVETTKGYLLHERETLEAVVNARNAAASALDALGSGSINAEGIQTLSGAENALGAALGKFNVVMEAYPDLKASANVQQLNEELASTENRVAFARQGFNDAVMSYNTYRQSFPNLLVANRFGHTEDAQLLEFDDSEQIQEAPKISFT